MTRSAKRIFSLVIALLVLFGAYWLVNNLLPAETVIVSAEDASGRFMLDVIDCGQGDSILAKTPDGYTVLVDAGDTDAREAILAELEEQKADHIDMLVMTHPHADHIGSMEAVIDRYRVSKVLMSGENHSTDAYIGLLEAVKHKNIPEVFAAPGDTYSFGDLSGELLGPLKDYDDLNDSSVVMRLKYGVNSFLLTGDTEKEAENGLLKAYGDLKADVLKVAHHGSGTSTSDRFLKAVSPRYAAISVGSGNDYNHPHPGTVKRLRKNGVTFYQTNLNGCIRFYSDGRTIEAKTEK